MISSLSSYSASYSTNSTSQTKSSNSLSLEDQELIDSILLNYDSDSLSSEDASAIVSAFSNAGIEPSKELSNAMDSLGFDAKEVGELAGVNSRSGMPPPPPPPPSDDSEEEDNVTSVLESLLSSDEDDSSSTTSSSFESIMDYTSRILSLEDSSKNDLMNILEEYSSEEKNLNKEDLQALVKNELNSVLSDSNNYKHTSYYA